MRRRPTHPRGRSQTAPRRRGFLATALLTTAVALTAGSTAVSAVPASPPSFPTPTTFTNDWFPITPGAVSMFRGKSSGETLAVARLFLDDTRTFPWDGGSVDTQLVKDVIFVGGEQVGVEKWWLAEAHNGSTYCFGVLREVHEDGEVVSHEGSWLVGGPQGGDPVTAADAADPTIFALATPEIGDSFKQEDVGPAIDTTVEVVKEPKKFKTEAGKFKAVLETREFEGPDLEPRGKKVYAKGVGQIAGKSDGRKLELIATSFMAAPAG